MREKNFDVARLFEEIARSLDVKGEQGHRPRAYRRAARAVASYPEPIEQLAEEGRLRDIAGIGPSLEALIAEYLASGSMGTHARLVAEHPPGLAPLLSARGYGPAAIAALHARTGVADLDDLERIAAEGLLAEAIGSKRAADLVAQLPSLRNPIRRLRLKSAWEVLSEVLELLGKTDAVHVVGDARRMCDLVVGGLEVVTSSSAIAELFVRLPGIDEVLEHSESLVRVRLYDGLQATLHFADAGTLGAALVWHSGSAAHLQRLTQLAQQRGFELSPTVRARTEQELYARLDLPWIAPELREDHGEIEAAQVGRLPTLMQQGDLKGDLHCHTDWTDGTNSLEDMAGAARDRGYEYMALTDHSRSLTITNGLSLERLEEARRCVQQLNHTLAPFVILLGTEMDILQDGSLDYPDDVLASLDYVSASVHARFKQSESQMTARILRAVTHPLVHTLNHPHGRLLVARPSYAVDMPRVIESAAAAGCALEVSADPARMDLDGDWARRVRDAGGRCTISSDAHSTLDYDNIWLGVGSARRGWLEPDHVLNTHSLDELRALLRRPRP
ncbi:MAG TPA: PHP domain-containing protein [Chloroflexota bacterium]|nr:PHP domain-containing protein [Chloroflexota bacterium]